MCVGSVCTHPSYNDKNPPSGFLKIPILKSPFSNQAVLRFLSEWRSSVLGLSRYQNFSIRYQYQWKSTVLGTNFGTKAKHKNMLIKKHIFINKVKQK